MFGDYTQIFTFTENTTEKTDSYYQSRFKATIKNESLYFDRNNYIRTILTSLKIGPGMKSSSIIPILELNSTIDDINVDKIRAILFWINIDIFNDLINGITIPEMGRTFYVLPDTVLPKLKRILNDVIGQEKDYPSNTAIQKLKAIECFHKVSCNKQLSGGYKKIKKTRKTRKTKRTKKSKKVTKRK